MAQAGCSQARLLHRYRCRAAELALAFEAHVRSLLLAVLLSEPPAEHPGAASGAAFLSMLLSLASLVLVFSCPH